MRIEPEGYQTGLMAALAGNLDSILATLLLSKRARIEDISVLDAGRIRLELAGEGVEQGLAMLVQLMGMAPEAAKASADDAEEEDGGKEAEVPSLWQALKAFALPPLPAGKQGKKKKK